MFSAVREMVSKLTQGIKMKLFPRKWMIPRLIDRDKSVKVNGDRLTIQWDQQFSLSWDWLISGPLFNFDWPFLR